MSRVVIVEPGDTIAMQVPDVEALKRDHGPALREVRLALALAAIVVAEHDVAHPGVRSAPVWHPLPPRALRQWLAAALSRVRP